MQQHTHYLVSQAMRRSLLMYVAGTPSGSLYHALREMPGGREWAKLAITANYSI